MKTRHILISTLFMALAGSAMAQNAPTSGNAVDAAPGTSMNSATTPSAVPSNDPFVQKRQADADAKAEYKAQKKAAKQEYKSDKKAAKAQLKQEKMESTAQRNEALATTPKTKTDTTH
ncbi:hypothetical protein [Herbaspirillum rubrisubalbicans]|jgi:hypothetical protein|uniref:Uncharacterized protein n=1 Tax=Herbaspirillum rubrisubalbicans Os34 TaxID=1235827 RepID=A0A6M3ZJ59_9BURK|nr:hypothetical protein [Herbaspirillum rubrisubalbicans]NQE50840.1 hypothetical protein [Herbaspirillum rubrisubalbicans]QJP98736.1 hypothetical protein C798_00370 [Herbaspirillum rubrisubalbicans Os34]